MTASRLNSGTPSTGYRIGRILLVAAAVVAPFTALRFSVVGVGEILLLCSLLLILMQSRGHFRIDQVTRPLVTFWVAYLGCISLGFLFNVFALGHASGTYSGAIFDFLSYTMILSVILMAGHSPLYSGTSAEDFFRRLFTLWGITFSTLYVLSLQTTQIMGLPLRYHSYFAPLVDNVHQAAMLTSPMPFVMWHMALRRQSMWMRLFYVVTGGLFAQMALESGSTKAALGLIAGAGVSAAFFIYQRLPLGRSRVLRGLTLGAIAAVTLMMLVASSDSLMPLAIRFFTDNDGNAAREHLYTRAYRHGLESMVIGYGPGPHIALAGDTFWDAHNTFLTVFLQGGICAVALFAVTLIRVGFGSSIPFFLLGALSAIGVYVLGGDVLRRLPTWLMVVGILFLSRQARRLRADDHDTRSGRLKSVAPGVSHRHSANAPPRSDEDHSPVGGADGDSVARMVSASASGRTSDARRR